MEAPAHWSHRGFGRMSFTTERARDGTHSLRLISPTVPEKPVEHEYGRPFGEAAVLRSFDHEDWSHYNRLSFWVYSTLPGFHAISLLMKFHNDGTTKVPDEYQREGLHFFLIKPGQWNHVVVEIAHLARDKVTGIEFIYRLQGSEPGASRQVCYDIDRLELERVDPDYYEGWGVAPGRIAYSQVGYPVDAQKRAFVADPGVRSFDVLDAETGKVVLNRPVEELKSDLGSFSVLDFSQLRQPGRYRLRAGMLTTSPFPIGDDLWDRTIWDTVNFFYCERCGFSVPGVHDVCHTDWQMIHRGQRIAINGGWHDAGDLSQGIINTAEATTALFELAEKIRPRNPALADRLIEEAQWGLDWVMKTRFGDGYRCDWATMDFWTDGVIGTSDDVTVDAVDSALDNFTASTAEATAARILKKIEPEVASRALKLAMEDWQFACNRTRNPDVRLASNGVIASVALFKATGERRFGDKAVELSSVIVDSQQKTLTDWDVPIRGFFYTTPRQTHILQYEHHTHYQAPALALCALCEALPDHADRAKWYSAVELHSEYLKRIAQFTAPYDMLPGAIYRLSASHDPHYQAQVKSGVRLSADYYVRRFPVWYMFRGNNPAILSHAKSLSVAALLLHDPASAALAREQLEWVLGRNPFAQSLMYGEGYDYQPQYTAMSGDMVGSLPVGIRTRGDLDVPYWPTMNCYNHKEVWVHPAARWLSILSDLATEPAPPRGPAQFRAK